jgi:hypothetical protein
MFQTKGVEKIKTCILCSEYVILIVFSLQQWSREGASMLRYTCTLPAVIFEILTEVMKAGNGEE